MASVGHPLLILGLGGLNNRLAPDIATPSYLTMNKIDKHALTSTKPTEKLAYKCTHMHTASIHALFCEVTCLMTSLSTIFMHGRQCDLLFSALFINANASEHCH